MVKLWLGHIASQEERQWVGLREARAAPVRERRGDER